MMVTNLRQLWLTLEACFDPMNEAAYAAWQDLAGRQGLEPGWMTCLTALFVFGPQPFTTPEFMRVFPYGSAQVLEGRFSAGVRQGLLAPVPAGGYCASQAGTSWTDQMIGVALATLGRFQLLPEHSLERLVGYSQRLVAASLSAPEPPSTFGASHYYRNMHPKEGASMLRQFVHYFGTLDKYRGNAHQAAWRQYGIQGSRWEVLSEVWGGQNNTLDKIAAELGSRGISRQEYAQVLDELLRRGWVLETAGVFSVSEAGQKLRGEAELLTDSFFFAPWACLSQPEAADLFTLATQLNDGLKELF